MYPYGGRHPLIKSNFLSHEARELLTLLDPQLLAEYDAARHAKDYKVLKQNWREIMVALGVTGRRDIKAKFGKEKARAKT